MLYMQQGEAYSYRNPSSILFSITPWERLGMDLMERHCARDLPQLKSGDSVWVRDQNRHGPLVNRANNPRSYLVQTSQETETKSFSTGWSQHRRQQQLIQHQQHPLVNQRVQLPLLQEEIIAASPSPRKETLAASKQLDLWLNS